MRGVLTMPSSLLQSGKYMFVFAMACVAMLVYVLMIPLGALLHLTRNRRHLMSPSFRRSYAFLYDGFKPQFFWWEVTVIVFTKVRWSHASLHDTQPCVTRPHDEHDGLVEHDRWLW